MTTAKSRPAMPTRKRVSTPNRIPPLQNGDSLTRDEFERRYEAMPHVKKAELIEGVVYMGSPVSIRHSEPHALLVAWLVNYKANTSGVSVGDNGTVRLDDDNEPQPDAYLRIVHPSAAQSKVGVKDCVDGAPEIVAEVSVTSTSIDMHHKLRAYCRNGVKEYVIWRVDDLAIDWMVLTRDRYVRQSLTDGLNKSGVFPGLWLDVKAMLAGDFAKVLAVLQRGLASPEHAAFVTQLESAAKPTKK